MEKAFACACKIMKFVFSPFIVSRYMVCNTHSMVTIYIPTRYFIQRQPTLQDRPDDSSSDSDSPEPSLPHAYEDLSINPDKVGLVKEMFPQLCDDEIILLLSLLHGNIHKAYVSKD